MEQEIQNPKPEPMGVEAELAKLNANRFIRMHNSMLHLIWVQFVKGLALGLGTVVGATILVSLAVVILSNIDFIPIIGEWAAQIAKQVEAAR